MSRHQYTPDYIQKLEDDEIFVFGSNQQGQHTGGAARCALIHFGAIMGMGQGRQGQCYAIPTIGCKLEDVAREIRTFVDFARNHADKTFLVTRIGCGMAGYTPEDIAPLLRCALGVPNIVLPKDFADILEVGKPREKYYLDLIKGSIVGGAAGDALGYAVEFMRLDDIIDEYGQRGIVKYRIREGDVALFSDDTQMTLFTANGMLNALGKSRQEMLESVKRAYLEWYGTQAGRNDNTPSECWIAKLPLMNHRRAPGGTCMGALHDINHGREADNFSKGCGGVMRTAPVALVGAATGMSIDDVCWLAAESARLTHKHPFGYLPSLVDAYIIYYSVINPVRPVAADVERWLAESFAVARRLYGNECPSAVQNLKAKVEEYMEIIHDSSLDDRAAIRRIGEGWVGEEAFGIALCSVLRHFDDFAAAMVMSVNHDGDSDSTGSITGNMLGALMGYSNIPPEFKQNLEGHDLLLDMSNRINKAAVSTHC